MGLLALLVASSCPPGPSPVPPLTSIGLQQIATGLTQPVGLNPAPDDSGRLFVVEQSGQIRIIDAGGNLLAAPFLSIADRLVSPGVGGDERGLLGLAFHPQYDTNGRFFVLYTAPRGPDTPADFNSQNHVSEFRVSNSDPNQADAASERIVLAVDQPQANHKGGQLAFGPDGFLYIGLGDGGGGGDIGTGHTPGLGNAQDKSRLLGKILRIDVDGGDPYGIPSDNPFVGDPSASPEVWAYGFRNPWRFSFDGGGDRQLFCGDVGQGLFEEVDIVTRGGNYGWNLKEGAHCYSNATPLNPPASCATAGADGAPLIDPIIEYPHVDAQQQRVGAAVIGGFVYRGAIQGLQGIYVFGDLSTFTLVPDGSIFAGEQLPDGTWQIRSLTVAGQPNGRLGQYILAFGQDAQGELYVLTARNFGPGGGTVYKIAPPG